GADMFRRILIPLDGSELAEKALKQALEIAKSYGSILHLTRVVPLIDLCGEYSSVAFIERLEKMRNRSQNYLNRKLDELRSEQLRVDATVLIGNPAIRVVELAEEREVDLIVVSSHGRTGLARWYFGSTAEDIARRSSLPVLLLPQMGRN
ncbi:MAG: universal stress protein, partial [Candidatus Eremiobacteraeota bacterium]|nr:universal stress protein [Candidatus Eremiobacteraeota bacterium]